MTVVATLDVAVDRMMPVAAERVAAVMFDAVNDQLWMRALTAVDVQDQPVAIGARVRRHARFLGRDISWMTVVRAYEPGRRLDLDIAEGPFVGVVTYEIEPVGSSSMVRIRNVGAPGKFTWMPVGLVRMAMRRSLAADLERLETAVLATA